MDELLLIVQTINSYLSNYVLIVLLIGAGLFFTIRTRFVQVRCFGEGIKRLFGGLNLNGEKHKSGMSSFQALATAIAAQVGTGNIVGASGAILTGGPGAIFWMWIIAFLGMATIYAEATLAQETRIVEKDGNVKGGPVYYITTAFKGGFGKFLAGFFAVAITLALGFMGCMVQSNSIGECFQTAFGIPSWVMGIVLVIICANVTRCAPFLHELNRELVLLLCITLAMRLIGLGLGFLLSTLFRFPYPVELTVTVNSSMRNNAAAATLAAQYFPSEVVFSPSVSPLFSQLTSSLAVRALQKRQQKIDHPAS